MFTMKSILTIAATTLMLVSVAQAAPSNDISSLFENTKSTGNANSALNSVLGVYDIQLTNTRHTNGGVYYITGTQHGNPIRLVCGPRSDTKSNALILYNDLLGQSPIHSEDHSISFAVPQKKFTFGNAICYIVPYYKCKKTYDNFNEKFKENSKQSEHDLKEMLPLWQKIVKGLNTIKEWGWYAHLDILDICVDKDKSGYKLHFYNFLNASPAKDPIDVATTNGYTLSGTIRSINEYNKRLIAVLIGGGLKSKKYDWNEYYRYLKMEDINPKNLVWQDIWESLKDYAIVFDNMMIDPKTANSNFRNN
ncbi:hypothetical protein BDF19DRAFT_496800 [Syncephalis fuscata]|nr:hypothetical protein BDF19DRAFT_496800 [Syncephalis fuscata]